MAGARVWVARAQAREGELVSVCAWMGKGLGLTRRAARAGGADTGYGWRVGEQAWVAKMGSGAGVVEKGEGHKPRLGWVAG